MHSPAYDSDNSSDDIELWRRRMDFSFGSVTNQQVSWRQSARSPIVLPTELNSDHWTLWNVHDELWNAVELGTWGRDKINIEEMAQVVRFSMQRTSGLILVRYGQRMKTEMKCKQIWYVQCVLVCILFFIGYAKKQYIACRIRRRERNLSRMAAYEAEEEAKDDATDEEISQNGSNDGEPSILFWTAIPDESTSPEVGDIFRSDGEFDDESDDESDEDDKESSIRCPTCRATVSEWIRTFCESKCPICFNIKQICINPGCGHGVCRECVTQLK